MRDRLEPARAFAHPLWWLALAVLVLNDHLLKAYPGLPELLTGKLSDLAGLFLIGPLLAALLRVRTARGFAWAHLAPGAVFAAINVSPGAAGAFEGLMAHTPFPWSIFVDPSDLLALPMLAVSYRVFLGFCRRPGAVAAGLRACAVTLGGVASLATSPPDPGPQTYVDPEPWEPPPPRRLSADFVLTNDTARSVMVRVRPLDPELTVACGAFAGDPLKALTRGMFGRPRVWLLDPGQQLDLTQDNRHACGFFALIDGTDLAPRLYTDQDPALTPGWPRDADGVLIEYLLSEAEGGTLRVDAPAGLLPAPPRTPEPAPAACGEGWDTLGLAWSEPPPGPWTVGAVNRAPDGCAAFELDRDTGSTRWFACTPAPLPFAAGDRIEFVNPGPDEVRLLGPRHAVRLVRGDRDASPLAGVTPVPDCGLAHDACGRVLRPLLAAVVDADGERLQAPAGVPVPLAGGHTFTLVRARQVLISPPDCSEDPGAAARAVEFVEIIEARDPQED